MTAIVVIADGGKGAAMVVVCVCVGGGARYQHAADKKSRDVATISQCDGSPFLS